ncbi:protein of unknown function [Paraoerskovia marina]|uniref:DUF4350 domain-containing protein n=1 Tax=Paraoerskovia marina TaxID=545619 RepID=A0A1H1QY60_9CELL|nr:DUF4350 domain-containing protein [Paraoerskovia marina]SDS28292.1 protein of unknown function [Paraoerskovia marina]
MTTPTPTLPSALHAPPHTAPGARPSRTRRARRARTWLTALGLVGGLVLVLLLLPRPSSTTPFSTETATPDGTRALAQVLRAQGVTVTETGSVDVAAESGVAGTTLVVAPGAYLEEEQVDLLVSTEADLVLLDPSRTLLDAATDGAVTRDYSAPASVRTTPGCEDPDAVAAGSVRSAGDLSSTGDGAVVCFVEDGAGAYAVVDGDRTVRVFADARAVTNEHVSTAGNAALALRAVGERPEVTWLVPALVPLEAEPGPGLLPPWLILVLLQGAVTVVVLGLWQGRHLGRVVTEPLPVVVRSSEATRGRARLYRRHGARGHAGAGLRAATARRLADRLGLPRSADPAAVVAAVSSASGRPTHEISALLYGPPPADDARLVELARHLDTLESEVHPL